MSKKEKLLYGVLIVVIIGVVVAIAAIKIVAYMNIATF